MNPDETTDPKTNVYDEMTLSNTLSISVGLNYNYLTIENKNQLIEKQIIHLHIIFHIIFHIICH